MMALSVPRTLERHPMQGLKTAASRSFRPFWHDCGGFETGRDVKKNKTTKDVDVPKLRSVSASS